MIDSLSKHATYYGNRTELSAIWPKIKRVLITKSDRIDLVDDVIFSADEDSERKLCNNKFTCMVFPKAKLTNKSVKFEVVVSEKISFK